MSDADDELEAARTALMRVRDDLARQLDAEPAWRALSQLEAAGANRELANSDLDAIKARLVARLDASVPKWRTLAGIEAAIAELGPHKSGRPRAQPEPPRLPPAVRAELPPPQVPHVRVESERTRYAPTTSRPAAAKGAPSGSSRPPNPRASLKKADTSSAPRTPTPRATSGRRLAAALGLAGEGPARLSAIEAEVERLVKRDAAGTWNDAPARRPPPPVRVDRPTAEVVQPPDHGEEAEVEIVPLAPLPKRDEQRPITKLADRLSRVDRDAEGDAQDEPMISMQADIAEASVEIEVVEPKDAAPAGRRHKDDVPRR